MKMKQMKHTKIAPKTLLILLAALGFSTSLEAQQEEVRVVKPYTPTLSAAEKIQLLPDLDGEIDYTPPSFTYELYPKRYDSQFQVEPIKAARMVKMPLKKLYKSQLTLGFGNYMTPLAELNISQLRSRKGSFGVNIRHHSMNGKVKLENDLKAPAGFNENKLDVYGSRFMKKSAFDYRVGASYNSYVHYGVDPALDSVLERKDAVHPYFTAEGGLGLHSTHADSFHFNYDASLEYYFFTHDFDQQEHGAEGKFDFHKKLRVLDIAAEVGGAYYGHYPDWDTVFGNHTMVWANPMIAKTATEWKFTAGFNTYLEFYGGEPYIHFYPRGSFQFNVVKEILVPYLGVDGYLESNNNRSIVEENPFVMPTLSLRPTSHKLIGYAGIKGSFSDAVAYNVKGSYSIIDDAYFFVNDRSNPLMNQFTVVYDDITLAKLHGELTIRPSDPWKVFLKGTYYSYVLVREDQPWNKPKFDLSLQARYNLGDKILVDAGIYAIGARYYENFNPVEEETLPLAIDVNLGLEYRYSTLLSFWARINNLAAQNYYLYHNYPAYKFRMMLGLTYAL
jgi:hypothetical protein